MLAPAAYAQDSKIAGRDIEIQIAPVSPHTFRLTVFPIENGQPAAIADDGSLIQSAWGAPIVKQRGTIHAQTVKAGGASIHIAPDPLSFTIQNAAGRNHAAAFHRSRNRRSSLSTRAPRPSSGSAKAVRSSTGAAKTSTNRSGQGGYQLRTFGGRVPIPFIIGSAGWAMFIHQPFGTFDFSGAESKFTPLYPTTAIFTPPAAQGQRPTPPAHAPLPIDLFFTTSREPAVIMAEYARLTGNPELPPLWSFGYQQSHRTLARPRRGSRRSSRPSARRNCPAMP